VGWYRLVGRYRLLGLAGGLGAGRCGARPGGARPGGARSRLATGPWRRTACPAGRWPAFVPASWWPAQVAIVRRPALVPAVRWPCNSRGSAVRRRRRRRPRRSHRPVRPGRSVGPGAGRLTGSGPRGRRLGLLAASLLGCRRALPVPGRTPAVGRAPMIDRTPAVGRAPMIGRAAAVGQGCADTRGRPVPARSPGSSSPGQRDGHQGGQADQDARHAYGQAQHAHMTERTSAGQMRDRARHHEDAAQHDRHGGHDRQGDGKPHPPAGSGIRAHRSTIASCVRRSQAIRAGPRITTCLRAARSRSPCRLPTAMSLTWYFGRSPGAFAAVRTRAIR
jgi:hypothetical protein